MSATVIVRELDDDACDKWDAFVQASDTATFFHRSGWRRVMESSLGHRCPYLMAEADGEVRGVLPLVHLNGRIFGKALISTGFLVLGGPAAADAAARDALDRAALDLANTLGVDYLEYRLQSPMHEGWELNSALYFLFRKEMAPDADANLKAIPRKQRAVVRKGLANGLQADLGADVDRFYRVFSESYRDLGTPILHKRFFAAILAVFGRDAEIVTVAQGGRDLCSVMVFFHRDQVLPYYGGGIREARELAAHDF
ncbi:MAG: FemAB family XrtA/PEP-CTERM system-associated protein, partial [Burkholderiales bacterium]